MRKFFTTAVLALAVLCSGLNAQVFTEDFGSTTTFNAWNQTVIAPGLTTAAHKFQRYTTAPSNPGAPALRSTTTANGWICLNSDLACDVPGQHVRIESPVIDCSTLTGVVEVKYEQVYQNYYDSTFLEVSVNNGPWNSIRVNGSVAVNAITSNPEPVVINISQYASGQSNVRIGFRYVSLNTNTRNGNGCAWAWSIDDVEVRSGSPINTTLENYLATQPSLYTPLGQIVPINFLAKATNRGLANASPEITVTVREGLAVTSTVVHNVSATVGPIAPNASDTSLIGAPYTPVTAMAHLVTYELNLPNNAIPQSRSIPFIATQNFFSKDNGRPSGLTTLATAVPAAGGGAFDQTKVANHYYVPNATTPNGDQWVATSVTFACYGGTFQNTGLGGDLAGKTFTVFMSKWVDANNNLFVDDSELTPVATGVETMPSPFFPDSVLFFSTQLYDLNTNGNYRLEANTNYLVGVEYTEPYSTATLAYLVRGTAYNTEPMEDAVYKANQGTRIQWGSCLFQDGTNGPSWFETVSELRTGPAMIDLNLDLEVGVRELANFKGELNIAPNPATTHFISTLKMEEEQAFVVYSVMDMAGRVIFTKRHENVKEEQVNFSVSELPAGTYNLTVRTQNGQNNKKFVVVK